MTNVTSGISEPQNIYGKQNLTRPSASDFFNLFYQSILAADSLLDFEANLFSFMYEVLQQQTCLFYNNVNQSEKEIHFILQRGSYSNQLSGTMLHKKFPTTIQLEINGNQEILQSKHCYEQQIDNAVNFFSVSAHPPRYPFISLFQEFGDYIRCGMLLLRSPQEIYGVLLYEHPLYHPYLDTPLRLQQFHAFLSLALAHRQTVHYATLDPLTNLHRKYYFLNLAKQQLFGKQKTKKYQLFIIDIDSLKEFNDTYGHLKGDHCLQAIAKAIKNSLRARDLTGHFGGEEFICLVQSELQQALAVTQRIHETIRKIELHNAIDQNILIPTVSIGIASFRQGETLNQLIEKTNKALYQAKHNGRNQTSISR